ncbi:MAG: Antibiotic biosynthesis monooxygenase [Massilia sp.]|nr:Antibiotic biosynthesis monooxygenase [Massilia sp.]
MAVSRRAAIAALVTVPAAAAEPVPQPAAAGPMFGLIGKMRAQPGQRDALIAILAEGTAAMPGCLGYVIAKDALDADALWITEAWVDAARHKASLALPSVRAAIARGRPLIAGFGERFETQPVAGLRPA